MLSLEQSPIYLLCLYGSLFFFYAIGKILFFAQKIAFRDFLKDVFFSTFLGVTVFVVVFSLFKAKLLSFNLLFIPILVFIFLEIRNSPFSENKPTFFPKITLPNAFFVFLMPFFFFALKIWVMYDQYAGFLSDWHGNEPDHLYYVRLTDYLVGFGKENREGFSNLYNNFGITPYHYFELWLTGGISQLFGLRTAYVFFLILFPILLSLLVWAYLILMQILLKKTTFYHYFMAVLFAFASIVYWKYLENPEYYSRLKALYFLWSDYASPFFTIKPLIQELLTVSALILFFKRPILGFYALLLQPIFSFITAPAIFSGVFVFVFLNIFVRWVALPNSRLLVLVCLEALFLVLLWKLSGKVGFMNELSNISLSDIANRFFSVEYWHLMGFEIRRFWILFLPFSLLACWFLWRFRQNIHFSIPLFVCIFFGSLLFGSLTLSYDWMQFFTSIAVSLLKIGFLVAVFLVFELYKKQFSAIFYYTFLLIIMWLAFRNVRNFQIKSTISEDKTPHSAVYLTQISQILQQDTASYLAVAYMWQAITDNYGMFTPNMELSYTRNGIWFIDMTWLYSKNLENNFVKILYRNSEWGRFLANSSENNDEKQKIRAFLKHYQIRYLVSTPQAQIPVWFDEICSKKIVDAKTQEIFWVLKP